MNSLVKSLNRKLDQARAQLAAERSARAALAEALAGMLESYDLLFNGQPGLPPVTADMVRGVFIGEPERARALLDQQPGRSSESGEVIE